MSVVISNRIHKTIISTFVALIIGAYLGAAGTSKPAHAASKPGQLKQRQKASVSANGAEGASKPFKFDVDFTPILGLGNPEGEGLGLQLAGGSFIKAAGCSALEPLPRGSSLQHLTFTLGASSGNALALRTPSSNWRPKAATTACRISGARAGTRHFPMSVEPSAASNTSSGCLGSRA